MIEKLHELFEYLAVRSLPDNASDDIDRLANELHRILKAKLILEQAGFGNQVREIEEHATRFSPRQRRCSEGGSGR